MIYVCSLVFQGEFEFLHIRSARAYLMDPGRLVDYDRECIILTLHVIHLYRFFEENMNFILIEVLETFYNHVSCHWVKKDSKNKGSDIYSPHTCLESSTL